MLSRAGGWSSAPVAFHFERAGEIPTCCSKFASVLEQAWRRRVVILEDWDDVTIFRVFHRSIEEESGWRMHWTCVRSQPTGGSFELVGSKLDERYSLDALTNSYQLVFTRLTTGWRSVSSEMYPHLLSQNDSREFALFFKRISLQDESDCLAAIVRKFYLQNDVKVWEQQHYNGAPICLLGIRKTAIPDVVAKMGLQLN